jgi:hypothetical protein
MKKLMKNRINRQSAASATGSAGAFSISARSLVNDANRLVHRTALPSPSPIAIEDKKPGSGFDMTPVPIGQTGGRRLNIPGDNNVQRSR